MAKIKFKRTSTVGRRPTGLESGEIGINLADRKIYVGDDSGAIIQLGNDPITTERLQAKAGATITNGLTVSGNQTNTGTITASGDIKGATVTSTGKATLGSVGTGALTATGVSTSTLTATGNTTLAGTKTGPLESTTLNATGVATVASLQTPGAISAGGNAVITGKVNAGSVETVSVVATGDVKGATVTATGKATVGSIGTGAITASSLVATGDVKSATVTTTGKAKSGSVETGAITGSTIAATGNVTTSAKITANEIELTKYDNFDSRYIKTGAAITNATKLSTPRKIAGVDFDGSADISIPAANVGALPANGGSLTGNVTSTGDITSSKIIQGSRVQASSRLSVYNTSSASFDLVNPNVDTLTSVSASNRFLGYMRFSEGSKITDVAGGVSRVGFQAYIPANTTGVKALWDTRDNATVVKTRIHMDSDSGVTRVDIGSFQAGTTTLGATTITNLTANGSITSAGTITVSNTDALALTHANASIELGSLTTAGSPYIDFHTSGQNVDYDIRLIANNTSLSVVSRLSILEDFNLKSIRNLRMNDSASSSLIMCRGSAVIRDHANGNVSISASKKSDTDTVGGDLYLGYNSGSTNLTNTVRLESPLWWKGTTQLVSSAGKLMGASLDTEYLPLTGGALTGDVSITRNGTPGVYFINSAIDTTVALPTATVYSGSITFNENRAGTNMIRSKIESVVTTTGATQLNMYVRDGSNVTKSQIRLESDTGLVNIATGGLRVSGTSTLVGDVVVNKSLTAATSMYVSGTGNKHLWFGTGSGDGDKGLVYASDVGNLHLRSGDGGNNGSVFVLSRSLTVDGNIWANKQSHGFADQWTTVAPLHVDFGQVPGNSDYYPIVRGRGTAAGYGYTTQVELGMLRQGNAAWGAGYLIVRNSEQTSGPQANYSFDISGNFQAPNQVGGAKMAVGVGTNSFGTASIAIGDNDSGFTSGGDGIIQLWCNSGRVWHGDAGQFYVDKQIITPNNDTFNNVYISSDIRLKTNFRKIENALDKVEKLEGLIYDKKSKLDSEEYDTTEAGIIAQTLQEVLPEAVTETNGILNVSSGATIALLVNAIKELKSKVEKLENK